VEGSVLGVGVLAHHSLWRWGFVGSKRGWMLVWFASGWGLNDRYDCTITIGSNLIFICRVLRSLECTLLLTTR
jgi:hypothetical protein